MEKICKILYRISFLLCALIGFAYRDSFDILRAFFDSIAMFLGIIASVSLALIALMLQSYEKLADGENIDAYKNYETWFKKNLKKEVARILIIVSPILVGMPLQFNVMTDCAFYVGFLFFNLSWAIISSVMLPIEFGYIVLYYVDLIFKKGKKREKEYNKKITDEIDKHIESLNKKDCGGNSNEVLECNIVR